MPAKSDMLLPLLRRTIESWTPMQDAPIATALSLSVSTPGAERGSRPANPPSTARRFCAFPRDWTFHGGESHEFRGLSEGGVCDLFGGNKRRGDRRADSEPQVCQTRSRIYLRSDGKFIQAATRGRQLLSTMQESERRQRIEVTADAFALWLTSLYAFGNGIHPGLLWDMLLKLYEFLEVLELITWTFDNSPRRGTAERQVIAFPSIQTTPPGLAFSWKCSQPRSHRPKSFRASSLHFGPLIRICGNGLSIRQPPIT